MDLRIIFLNCNSLCSKLSEIKNLVENQKANFFVLVKPGLQNMSLNLKITNVNGSTDQIVLEED